MLVEGSSRPVVHFTSSPNVMGDFRAVMTSPNGLHATSFPPMVNVPPPLAVLAGLISSPCCPSSAKEACQVLSGPGRQVVVSPNTIAAARHFCVGAHQLVLHGNPNLPRLQQPQPGPRFPRHAIRHSRNPPTLAATMSPNTVERFTHIKLDRPGRDPPVLCMSDHPAQHHQQFGGLFPLCRQLEWGTLLNSVPPRATTVERTI